MSEIPVTQEMFVPLIGKNPSHNIGDNFPVENAYYCDILRFCEILSELNGKAVRLPTDAEWEYAARVGTSNPCFKPKYSEQLGKNIQPASTNGPNAWGLYDPRPVKSLPANAWGLYDMFGYAWHIMSDYKDINPRTELVDPKGPPAGTKTIQTNDFGPMHRSKGGYYYNIIRPPMHGAAGENGTLWENGQVIFRVVVDMPIE
jgi:formylglycine-generating enzyme required for sulfatase activity